MSIISAIALAATLALTPAPAANDINKPEKAEKSKIELTLFTARVKAVVSAINLQEALARRSSTVAAGTNDFRDFDTCPRPGGGGNNSACLDSVCARLGAFGCDDQSEISQVLDICRGNFNGDCVTTVCGKLGSFGCDDFSEVKQVAEMCRGSFGGGCVQSVCSHLGSFGCDDVSEIKQVVGACQGNRDNTCVESVCSRLGSFGCDDMSEILTVVRECGGH